MFTIRQKINNIKQSKRKNKKYVVELNDRTKIHFGDSRYQQFQDSTGLGIFSDQNHNDEQRRISYYRRFSGVNTKKAALKKEFYKSKGKYNAKILSHLYLW